MMATDYVRDLPTNKPIRLRNSTCIYCSIPFDGSIRRTKEHVIGKCFVPSGAIGQQWNLLANACGRCNNMKSRLETDISAITMMPDPFGRLPVDDASLREEILRKSKGARSVRTGKSVIDSHEKIRIRGEVLPGLHAELELICGPQIDLDRAYALARCHVCAFYYYLTYDINLRRGLFWLGDFVPVSMVSRSDWGNARLQGFTRLIDNWPLGIRAIVASEYFRIVIRRSPATDDVWAWAIEWNRNQRVFGFFGDRSLCSKFAAKLPTPGGVPLDTGSEPRWTAHQEKELDPKDDVLFSCNKHS